MKNKAPNLLFVFSDQQRWCDLGCYGNREVISPCFDRFALDAAVVDCGITNAPVCVPIRGSLITGYMPNNHRAATNDLPIRHDITGIADVLKANGYHTGYIGKWHLAGVPREQTIPENERFGFTEWKVNNCSHDYMNWSYYDENENFFSGKSYEPEMQTDLALDFIERSGRPDSAPFALYVSWGPPHNPYHCMPQKYLDMYRDRPITLRPNVGDTVADLRVREWGYVDTEDMDRTYIEEIHRGYYAHITALDGQFGRMMDKLDEMGIAEDTIVVFTSDHGDLLGSHGFTDKQYPHDESVRVPLLLRWKGKVKAGYYDEIASLVDLPETLLSMMGCSFAEKRDGEDLSKMFLEGAPGLDAAYIASHVCSHVAATRPYDAWRGLRTKDYMYAREAHNDCAFLFDMKKDPYQMNNLARNPEYAPLVAEFKKRLNEKAASYGDAVVDWKEFLLRNNLVEVWDASQKWFRQPLFETGKVASFSRVDESKAF